MALINFFNNTYRDERGASVARYGLIFALVALVGVVADSTPRGHDAANFVLKHVNSAIEAFR